jgi:hypothetical protein
MTFRRLIIAAALAVAGCRPGPLPPPPHPVPPPPEEACDDAARALERLQCLREDGTPYWKTPAGAPFALACKAALRDGRNWNPHCIAKIGACSEFKCAYRGACCGGT